MRFLLAALILLAALVYSGTPSQRPLAVGLIGLAGLVGIAAGVVAFRPERRSGWLLIGLAVALLTAGNVWYAILANISPGPVAYPGPPDVFYLLAYVPLAVGLVLLGRPRLPSLDWPLLLDTAALSLAAALIVWIVLIRPAVTSVQLSDAGKVTGIASWVGYVAVLAAAARVLIAWRTNVALALLAAAVGSFLAADFLYGRERIHAEYSAASAIDIGFLAFSLLCGIAALTPSMARVGPAGLARHQLGPLRLAILAVGLLVAPTALLVEASVGAVTTAAAIAIVGGAIGILMLVRLSITAQAYRGRVRRELAVRAASRQLVQANSDDEVVAGVAHAVRSMLPAGTASAVDLVGAGEIGEDQEISRGGLDYVDIPLEAGTDVGEERAPSDATATPQPEDVSRRRSLRVWAPPIDLAELDPILRGLADQAASAIKRIGLFTDLRAEERERYFRTLVLTSDDVTLISHDGRVTYATPSAQTMFGYDVTGVAVDELMVWTAPGRAWTTTSGSEAVVRRHGEELTVWVRSRDLHGDPTVGGVVTTLRDITAERRLQADLAFRASHDPLTGLANAQHFSDELDADWQPAVESCSDARHGRAALFIDLDDFKIVNDTYGHRVGDLLLTEVGRRIEGCLRTADLAARIGGDEFAVLLREVGDVDTARGVAQRIADSLSSPTFIGDLVVDGRASIGLAYGDEADNSGSLLWQADTALYSAKAMGKGQWRQYHDGMPIPTRHHVESRRRLEEALRQGELAMHYQPIVDLRTSEPVGFEALIRLAGDPPMAAEQIVAAAEDTGLIPALGSWVLDHALQDLSALNPPNAAASRFVSVNISPRQLHQPDFVEMVRRHVTAAGADPALIVLEVTENLLVEDEDDRTWDFLTALRADGIRIALDDYGTGHASFGYLRKPVFDIVKTDRWFLADHQSVGRNRILLEAVMRLCQQLNLDVVVEGVEAVANRDLAIAAGARHGQGFYYAPALPVAEAAAWRASR